MKKKKNHGIKKLGIIMTYTEDPHLCALMPCTSIKLIGQVIHNHHPNFPLAVAQINPHFTPWILWDGVALTEAPLFCAAASS